MKNSNPTKGAQTLYLDRDGVYKAYNEMPSAALPSTFTFPTTPVPTWAIDDNYRATADKPQSWGRKNAGAFARSATSDVVVVVAVIMGFVASPVFFCVPIVGVMSAMMNWEAASSTTSHVHRRRKGRTTLPLADVGTGRTHTRMNY